MNLLDDAWLPVADASGVVRRVRPCEVAGPDLVAFAWGRPDFDGAAHELLIGLLHLAMMPDDADDWRARHDAPPSAADLEAALTPYRGAFELAGPGPRFLQDAGAIGGGDFPAAALLIDSPTEQGMKNNLDIFVKRDRVAGLCRPCAAMALFTLQTYAPAGGAGHRTGLRGGGPLTTLVRGDTLWRSLWRNVIPFEDFSDADPTRPPPVLPWMGCMPKGGGAGEVQPGQVAGLQMFFGMPRRIWLDTEGGRQGHCDLCGAGPGRLVERYESKPHGINYKGGWLHPLTPHAGQGTDKRTATPRHGSPRGIDYRDWLSLVFNPVPTPEGGGAKVSRWPAQAVERFRFHQGKFGLGPARLWAFGYDNDKAKTRGWNDSLLPIVPVAGDEIRYVTRMGDLVTAADEAGRALRRHVKAALFARPMDVKADFEHLAGELMARTEAAFGAARDTLAATADADWNAAWAEASNTFLAVLRRQTIAAFDRAIDVVPVEDGDMKRAANARRRLRYDLARISDAALGLAVKPAAGRRGKSASKEK